MLTREEITTLVEALNGATLEAGMQLREEEYLQLETVVRVHPEVWPVGLADTFQLLQRKLRWQTIDRGMIPEPLLQFFDEKFRRDLDPMALARNLGHDLGAACEECSCRC